MATYIVLMNWTEQGIKNVKDSPKRLDGPYDAVAVLEAPNDEALAKFALATGATGSVRTTTLKAYPEDAYRKIMAAL
jgi:uncharacterized protein with GYD domain